jgi:hypothetical protein
MSNHLAKKFAEAYLRSLNVGLDFSITYISEKRIISKYENNVFAECNTEDDDTILFYVTEIGIELSDSNDEDNTIAILRCKDPRKDRSMLSARLGSLI